jgi:hypothetical protein
VRYRLVIVAPNMLTAVRHTGGFMFDRVMAGWDVMVLLADDSDVRPLQILGAGTVDLEAALVWRGRGLCPQAVAVCADLFEEDVRVREGVLETLNRGETELTLWGDTPTQLDDQTETVQHRLSVAARAFKRHALAAASVDDAVGSSELFRSGELLTCAAQGRADLIPA